MNDPPPLPGGCALFLDIDGTLLDIMPHPDDVTVAPSLIATLIAVRVRMDGALALVSGRDLTDVDRLFCGGDFDIVGSHGLEWRTATAGHDTVGVAQQPSGDAIDIMRTWAAALPELLPGLTIECKRYGIALHYRSIPERKAETEALARAVLADLGPGYHGLAGKAVVELISVDAEKGAAIQRLMAFAPYQGRRPVFAGDDVTDESAFETVNRLGGLSIHIGDNGETQACYSLATPAALLDWLRRTVSRPVENAQ